MRTFVVALSLVTACAWCVAQTTTPQQPGNEQVIQPQVERREVKLPKYPSKDFEIGAYLGTYAMQNFGSSLVGGVRLGYHISEDIFVQAVYGQTKVSDESFRQILPGGIFAQPEETLKYYNLSVGYNILPGEVFWGRSTAFASSLYVIAGIGNTNFIASDKVNHRNRQTINYGAGIRVLFHDRFSVQMDMRQHIFDLDILGKNESTKNLEWTGGVSFYF
ncbi:MAG TPA: outer membrane beta-barrel domain-containing protein [Burkholderiaceae bacterium]|nr:outer membrane beta-barrel domain-containing protein [Burkholderiaceae bacterium]